MSSNMPILWQNALEQFSTEIARKAWIWFAETRGEGMQYESDSYACEVENIVLTLRHMICISNKTHNASEEVIDDLMRFILVRHANYRLGGNVKPDFLCVS